VGAVEVASSPACASKPAKPVLQKPGNTNKAKGPTIALDWNDSQCADRYKVIIRLGSPTGAKFQSKGGLTASEFTTKPVSKNKTYAWRVIALNGSGKAKSEWWTFKAK
jgi:hypothetical protein